MSKTKTNSQLKKFLLTAVIAIIVIAAIALLRNQSTAEIAIAPTGQQALVFTNKSERKMTDPEATTTYSVRSGDIEVIVSSNGRYPWRETVAVNNGSSTHVQPFLIPEQPRIVRDVPNAVQEALTRQQINPTKSATSSDQQVRIIANENDRLVAEWIGPRDEMPSFYSCQNEADRCGVEVYAQNGQSIEQADFYPGRSDVAVFATESGVYVIEIDPTGETQNFHPVNTSLADPHFVVTSSAIFVGNDSQVTVSQL